jgi:Xaa-Pro aminopeptidase
MKPAAAATDRIPVRVSNGELDRRWNAVRTLMAEQGIQALVIQNREDWLGGTIKWFTDIPTNNGYPRSVVFHADDLMTVVEMGPFGGRRLLDGADEIHRGVGEVLFAPSFTSVSYTQEYDARLVADVLKRRGYRTVGLVGGSSMPHGFVTVIGEALAGNTNLVDASDLIDNLKAIKSDEEIALIRGTARMQDEVFAKVLAAIEPGMRDVDVAALAWHESQIRGSEQGIVLGTSAPLGVRSGFAGRHMQGRTLQRGDHLSLLIETNGPGGFYAEIARTIVLGRASQELLDGFAAMRDAQQATLALMKPGAPAQAIAAAHDAYMVERGLPAERRLYSHGQGYDMVERPLIRRDEPMLIEVGMCQAVHPGYETPSLFAVICDNYLIGPDGAGECLHRTDKMVFEV